MERLPVFVLCDVWCVGDVQRHDRVGIDQYLAGAESESLYILVLHHELLPLSDGDLSAQRHRDGAVGHVYVCCADLGRFQCACARVGSTAGAVVDELGGRICDRGGGGEFAGESICL